MVTKKPKGLGRGLEALLGPKVHDEPSSPEAVEAAANRLPSHLPLTHLVPGMYQPRTRMDEGALYELAESIKAQGIMQPILVRRLGQGPDSGKYEIIAGERRFRAARLAGLSEVPVLVRDVPNEAAAAMALIENMQREDLNPLEEAQGLQRLIKEFGADFSLVQQKPKKEKSRDIRRVEEELSDHLMAQVEVRIKKRVKRHGRIEEMGELSIQFGSLEELNGLIDKLRA